MMFRFLKSAAALMLFILMMGSIGAYEQGAAFYPSVPMALMAFVLLGTASDAYRW